MTVEKKNRDIGNAMREFLGWLRKDRSMEAAQNIEPLLDAKEVKKLLRCSLPYIYKAAEEGLLPSVRIPCETRGKKPRNLIRFKRGDIFSFIERHYRTPNS